MSAVRFAQKFLMTKPFVVNGNTYQFISVEPEGGVDHDNIQFTVNVVPPKKGGSYIREFFSQDISQIMEKLWAYFGGQFSYYERILVDGKEAKDSYISPEDRKEIIESLNQRIKRVKLSNTIVIGNFDRPKSLEANLSFRYNPHIGTNPDLDSNSIIFYFLYEVRDVKLNGKSVEINLHQYDTFAEVFNEKLLNEDSFRDEVDSIVYNVLNLDMDYSEFYVQSHFWLDKVEGREVEVTGNSFTYNFTPKMFN